MNDQLNTPQQKQYMTSSTNHLSNRKKKKLNSSILPFFCCYREEENDNENNSFHEHSLKNPKLDTIIVTNFSIDASSNIEYNRQFFQQHELGHQFITLQKMKYYIFKGKRITLQNYPLLINFKSFQKTFNNSQSQFVQNILSHFDNTSQVLIDIPIEISTQFIEEVSQNNLNLIITVQANGYAGSFFQSSIVPKSPIETSNWLSTFEQFNVKSNTDIIVVNQNTKFRAEALSKLNAIILIPFWNYKLALLLDSKTQSLPDIYKVHLLKQLLNYNCCIQKVILLLPATLHIQEILQILSLFQEIRGPILKQDLAMEISSVGGKSLEIIQVRFGQSKASDIKQVLINNIFNEMMYGATKEQLQAFEQLYSEIDGIGILKLVQKYPRGIQINKKQDLESFYETLNQLKIRNENIAQLKQLLIQKEQQQPKVSSAYSGKQFNDQSSPKRSPPQLSEDFSSYNYGPISYMDSEMSFPLRSNIQFLTESIEPKNEGENCQKEIQD